MNDDNGFEVVERPRWKRGQRSHQWDAIIATAESGKAVRIPLEGRGVHKVESSLRAVLRSRGLLVRSQNTEDGFITVWAEKKA